MGGKEYPCAGVGVKCEYFGAGVGNPLNLYQITIGQRAKARYNLAQGLLKTNGTLPQMASTCKHPRVRVVSRQEDVEYVECVECGEVFDSDEFRDMEIEEKVTNPEDDDFDG
jgi:Zn ribbon nucleic-acid-binding protein